MNAFSLATVGMWSPVAASAGWWTLPSYSWGQWVLAFIAALLCGVSKAGLSGVGLITVLIIAHLEPGQASSGVVLPLLVGADILAASRYRQHIQWPVILRVGVPMLIGVVLGTVFMWLTQNQSAQLFNRIVAGLVLSMCVLQCARLLWPAMDQRLPQSRLFAWATGLIGGVATMLANAAGPISTLYLLIIGLGKKEFVHTMAWWFLLLNVIKVPFSWSLGLINVNTLPLNAALFPGVIVGFILGRKIVDIIPQKAFSWIVMVFAIAFSVKLLVA